MPPEVVVAVADTSEAEAWARLREALWPGEPDRHRMAIGHALARPSPDRLALIASAGGQDIGLAEASVRHDYVNGCDGSPVAFLEGLYVAPDHRRRGVARALVDRVAAWGRSKGCAEFASDAPIDNAASRLLHRALGFEETEQVVFFRRPLAP